MDEELSHARIYGLSGAMPKLPVNDAGPVLGGRWIMGTSRSEDALTLELSDGSYVRIAGDGLTITRSAPPT